MSRYGLFGKLTAHPGQRDELLALLLQAAAQMDDVPGCEIWIVNASQDDPNSVWVSEVWRSQADHAASLTGEATRALIAQARPLIAGMEHVTLTPLAGKGLEGDAQT